MNMHMRFFTLILKVPNIHKSGISPRRLAHILFGVN